MSDPQSFLSPGSQPPTRYMRPIRRARLAPAGVEGPKATPTPFRSSAEVTGAPTHDKNDVNNLEQEFEDTHGGAPRPAGSIGGKKFILDEGEFSAVFDKLRRFTSNRALRLGDRLVVDSVMVYLDTFKALVIEAEDAHNLDAAVLSFSMETGTPVELAKQIVNTINGFDDDAALAALAGEIINLYNNVGSPPSPSAASVGSPGADELVKGMADVLGKFGSSAPTTDFTAARGIMLANIPAFYAELSHVDYGSTVIPLTPWATVANTAPLDRLGLLSRPLATPNKLSGMLLPVVKERSLYPQTRNSILFEVATLYAHHLGLHILSGIAANVAAVSAEADASRVLAQ